MALGDTIRALTGNYKWTANSWNQNAELEMVVCAVGGSSSQTTCAGEPGQAPLCQGGCHWRVAQQGWRCWHSPFPSCTVLAAAFPAWQSLDVREPYVNIPPFFVGAQGLYSLWKKAWPSLPHGKHWHIQVIVSRLFSKLRTGVFVKLGGQLGPCLLCHPPAAPCGTTAGRGTGTAESPVLMCLP